jgi:hypothetical protein
MDDVAQRSAEERRDLFTEAAAQWGNIAPEVIEKDFWVCWTLKHIFDLGPAPAHLVFKGGTSLSKVYGVIERFSEDIDLSLSREDLGFGGERNPYNAPSRKKQDALIDQLVARCTEAIATDLLPRLRERFASVLGPEGTERGWSLSIDDSDAQTVNFSYAPGVLLGRTAPPRYLRPIIRLELGARSDHWPAEDRSVRPYAAEVMPEQFAKPECPVRVLSAERTFWEKATILHAECHRGPGKPPGERQTRHYYDLVKLYENPLGQNALKRIDLLAAVVKHKMLFFRSGWARYEEAKPGSFRLVPSADRLPQLKADYAEMQEVMIFGDSPSFEAILETLAAIETEINQFPGRD